VATTIPTSFPADVHPVLTRTHLATITEWYESTLRDSDKADGPEDVFWYDGQHTAYESVLRLLHGMPMNDLCRLCTPEAASPYCTGGHDAPEPDPEQSDPAALLAAAVSLLDRVQVRTVPAAATLVGALTDLRVIAHDLALNGPARQPTEAGIKHAHDTGLITDDEARIERALVAHDRTFGPGA
jgi:hypothetical protein